MELPGEMDWVVQGDLLHIDVAVTVPTLAPPDRLLKRLERELIKDKARQRTHKKALVRRTRTIMSNILAESSSKDRMEDAPPPAPQSELEHAEYFSSQTPFHVPTPVQSPSTPLATLASLLAPPPPASPPQTLAPAIAPAVAPAVASATTSELERKIARLEGELHNRDRSRQKRSDAFRSLRNSEHEKMLDLMDARAIIARLEEELKESKRETVSWTQLAEKFKEERYLEFAHTIDPVPPPPPRAIEWGILAKQPEFWAGVVGIVSLLAGVYAAGKYISYNAPAVPLPCPRQIPCPRLPRVESPRALSCPKVECPRVTDCLAVPVLPAATAEKCRGNGHMMAAYGFGAITGGIATWQTVKAMD